MRRVKETKAEVKTNEWYDLRFPLMRVKLNLQGRRGWPDQEYFIPGGRPFLIEFKAEGEEPRALQSHIHRKLKEHGYDIEVHTEAAKAIAAIKSRLESSAVHDRRSPVLAGAGVRRAVAKTRAA